jgi:hypothetical protein
VAWVFGRERQDPHLLDRALADLLNGPASPVDQEARQALARNLQFDPRVSPERESEFLTAVGTVSTGAELSNAWVRYFTERIRSQPKPEYVSVQLNGRNLVSGGPTGSAILKDLFLGQILDLNGLTIPFRWGHEQGWPELMSFPPRAVTDDEAMTTWLDEEIGVTGPETFVPTVLRLLNAYRRHQSFQPVWVALWTDLEPVLVGEPPRRWLERLGVGRSWITATTGRWLIALRYRVRDVDWLVRPTTLDAGTNPAHFPSPLKARDRHLMWGHSMDLDFRASGTSLFKEFIHRQIDLDEAYWRAAGSICRKVETPTMNDLTEQRTAHLERLRHRYPSELVDWKAI